MPTMPHVETPIRPDTHDVELSKRLDAIGWGLLLVMTGAIWLFPESRIPQGTWLMGAGVLVLLLNGARYAMRIRVKGFITFLGAVALAAGLSAYLGIRLPLLAICLILIGASIILRPPAQHAA